MLSEAVLRLLGISPNINRLWHYHPVLGWNQHPSKTFKLPTGVSLSINAAGFRDDEHLIKKPPGTRRIVVIGDSLLLSGCAEVNWPVSPSSTKYGRKASLSL
jgi:hypothetical protein